MSSIIDEALGSLTPTWIEARYGPGKWAGDYFVCQSPLDPGSGLRFAIKTDGTWARGVGGTGNTGTVVDLVAKTEKLTKEKAAALILGRSLEGAKTARKGKVKPKYPVTPEDIKALGVHVKGTHAATTHGKALKVARYSRQDGTPAFCVVRFAKDEATTSLPYYLGEDGEWHEGYPTDVARPLYNLPSINGTPILVVADEWLAREPIPGWVVTTWAGGVKDVAKTDWSPLDDLEHVTLWLSGPELKAVRARLDKAKVLDLAQFGEGWTRDSVAATGADVASWLESCPRVDVAGANGRPDDGLPFLCLGYDKSAYYFLPKKTRVVHTIGVGAFRSSQIQELAPLSWWGAEGLVGDQGGIKQAVAMDMLIQVQHRVGWYDPQTIRGAGVWKDASGIIINDGARIVTMDRKAVGYDDFKSRFNYVPSNIGFGSMHGAQSTDDEGRTLERLFKVQGFTSSGQAVALMGWCLIACFGGVLSWRPHGWLTGKAESGKSWLWENVILPIVGPFALKGSGASTEAGTRRDLNNDARPALMPEMEPKSEKAATKVKAMLELARNSSDDSSGVITMAKAGGGTESFHIRSMFLFNSKAVPEDDASVSGRIMIFELKSGVDMSAKKAESARLMRTGVLDDAGKFRRRIFHALPRILQDIEYIRSTYFGVFGRQRAVDQVAPLIAAAWACQSSASVSTAGEWLDRVIDELARGGVSHEEDEDAFFRVLLASTIRTDENKTRTVAELLTSGARDDGDDARSLLERNGIGLKRKYGVDVWKLVVAVNSAKVAEMFKGTNFATGYGSYLKRHPLHDGDPAPAHLAGSSVRCQAIDWERFRAQYLDLGVDDDVPF